MYVVFSATKTPEGRIYISDFYHSNGSTGVFNTKEEALNFILEDMNENIEDTIEHFKSLENKPLKDYLKPSEKYFKNVTEDSYKKTSTTMTYPDGMIDKYFIEEF